MSSPDSNRTAAQDAAGAHVSRVVLSDITVGKQVAQAETLRTQNEIFSRVLNSLDALVCVVRMEIATDITDRKRAEEERLGFERRLQQLHKAESLNRMAGAVAHHFNNQLQAVMWNLEIAMEAPPRGKDSVESLTDAMQAARKAAEVSSLMLTYAGQTVVEREPLDLSEACQRHLPMLRTALPKDVVLGIVRAHCGAIAVESESGRGSIFRVFLPVSAAVVPQKPVPEPGRAELPLSPNLEAAQQRRPTRFRASEQVRTEPGYLQAASGPKTAGGGTVLVVEDEPAVRKMVTLKLKRLGFTVLEAEDGVEAVEIFRQHRDEIDYVLCDLTMPRMDGWETLTALRKLAPGIPVILSSGYSEAQVMEGHHSDLPQAFLSKPYDHKALINAINQVLC